MELQKHLAEAMNVDEGVFRDSVTAVKVGEDTDNIKLLIIDAIGSLADVGKSHTALRDFATEKAISDGLKVSIISWLGARSGAPTETLEFLADWSRGEDRLSRIALSTLGHLILKLDDIDPIKQQAVARMVQLHLHLMRSQNPAVLRNTLQSIGAIKSPLTERLIRGYLYSERPEVRDAAVRGFAMLATSDRYSTLTNLFISDSGIQIRLAALEGLYPYPGQSQVQQVTGSGSIPEETVEALRRGLTDPSEQVRERVLQYFGDCYQSADRVPKFVVTEVKRLAHVDTSEDIRSNAVHILKHRWGLNWPQ